MGGAPLHRPIAAMVHFLLEIEFHKEPHHYRCCPTRNRVSNRRKTIYVDVDFISQLRSLLLQLNELSKNRDDA
jgi:hypothetical protein